MEAKIAPTAVQNELQHQVRNRLTNRCEKGAKREPKGRPEARKIGEKMSSTQRRSSTNKAWAGTGECASPTMPCIRDGTEADTEAWLNTADARKGRAVFNRFAHSAGPGQGITGLMGQWVDGSVG